MQQAQQQMAAQRAQQDQLNQALAQERARRGAMEELLAKRQGVLGFVLMPGLARDTDSLKRLVIPADAGSVRLELDPKSNAAYKSYRAELRTIDGDVLWSANVSQRVVTVPARL